MYLEYEDSQTNLRYGNKLAVLISTVLTQAKSGEYWTAGQVLISNLVRQD